MRSLTVDLGGVSFVDSTGIRALIHGHAAASDLGVPLRVANLRHPVTRVLEITGVLEALTA